MKDRRISVLMGYLVRDTCGLTEKLVEWETPGLQHAASASCSTFAAAR